MANTCEACTCTRGLGSLDVQTDLFFSPVSTTLHWYKIRLASRCYCPMGIAKRVRCADCTEQAVCNVDCNSIMPLPVCTSCRLFLVSFGTTFFPQPPSENTSREFYTKPTLHVHPVYASHDAWSSAASADQIVMMELLACLRILSRAGQAFGTTKTCSMQQNNCPVIIAPSS